MAGEARPTGHQSERVQDKAAVLDLTALEPIDAGAPKPGRARPVAATPRKLPRRVPVHSNRAITLSTSVIHSWID